MKHPTLFLAVLVVSTLLATVPPAAAANGWAFSAGVYDTEETERPLEVGVEYRFEAFTLEKIPLLRHAPLIPVVGFAGTEDGNFWGYGGLRADWEFSPRWYLTPQVGAGLYEQGDGKDLGGVIQFRSGLELSRRLRSGARLGLLFYHLSNSSIYRLNPGSNSLVVTFSLGR